MCLGGSRGGIFVLWILLALRMNPSSYGYNRSFTAVFQGSTFSLLFLILLSSTVHVCDCHNDLLLLINVARMTSLVPTLVAAMPLN